MIPAREINLGNIMIHPNSGEPCVIEPQDMLSIMERELNGYNQNYEPIPIDAEWLERFGAKQEIWKLADGVTERYWLFENENMPLLTDNLQIDGKDNVPVKFVHQLQNLHYCLTHTELTTKKEI